MLLFSEAMHLCELDPSKMEKPSFFDVRHILRVRFSAQIDKGRWFFPNYPAPGIGDQKQEAFRGYRHEVLDCLVDAYIKLNTLNYSDMSKNSEHRSAFEKIKRAFTSEIQKIIDPRSRDEEFKKLIESVK